MDHAGLAALLVEAADPEREAVLAENSHLADTQLAYILKDVCLNGWSSHAGQALGAAAALQLLSRKYGNPEIVALRSWASGLAALINGEMESAVADLDDSHARFLNLNNPHTAAETQVSKLVALAMLGRYDEAINCGMVAREQFLADGDLLAVGKIEHNIGNIYFRRDRYHEAEHFQRAAQERFLAADDQIQITKIENSLALTLSQQHRIRSAEELYTRALKRAEQVGLTTTQAEIESSIGTLALYQGQYDRALDFLERSRRKYAELKMSHISAMTEQEIADAYLELNLAPEAIEIYKRVTREFRHLGMRAEAAHALAYQGRAALSLDQTEEARTLFARARELYAVEGNEVGAAIVRLAEAQLLYAQRDYRGARLAIAELEPAFVEAGVPRWLMFARWLKGECARAEGLSGAGELLRSALNEAESEAQLDVVARCLTSLGLLAAASGQRSSAEDHFKRAVTLIEQLRAPLPAEEFRSAFFADKSVPYTELVRLCLSESKIRVREALLYVERARSRGLVDALSGAVTPRFKARDAFDESVLRELEELRAELNYFYNQVIQRARSAAVGHQDEMSALHQAIREREAKTLELARQLSHRAQSEVSQSEGLDLDQLQKSLGKKWALIEYTALDDQLLAFVITDESIEVVGNLGGEKELAQAIAQFRFQIDTLRYGSRTIREKLPLLTDRARRHLESLHAKLLAPFTAAIADRDLLIVPYRSLHYLPFQALYDGNAHVIEQREVMYAPSAAVLQQCLSRSKAPVKKALLMGVADEQTPLIHQEVNRLSKCFQDSRVFVDENARLEVLRTEAPDRDVVHLACHAQFRSDNPLFSSLRLGDGWLTVRDAYNLRLNSQLVTLSACETGVNALAPGEELIGLARGFFAAGTPSVLLSLWTVDDEATSELMFDFYNELQKTESLSQSLRTAQIKALKERPHPFFWAPFVLVGRW